jgi:hypothetical protein
MGQCPICGNETRKCFDGKLLSKYDVSYYQCSECRFIQTEKPFWLQEAYANVINVEDTGLLDRNIYLSEVAAIIIYWCFRRNGIYLDYAGGYGVFTRLMRDIGFDFYWHDPYAQNIFSRGFEFHEHNHSPIELLTSFESFEHFLDPIAEIEKMMKISQNVLFSTKFLPLPTPALKDWWYYGPEHGQHISFFTPQACMFLAQRFRVHFYSFGDIHIFSKRRIHTAIIGFLLHRLKQKTIRHIRLNMKSKTVSDSLLLSRHERRSG